jgi:hypothetical protein
MDNATAYQSASATLMGSAVAAVLFIATLTFYSSTLLRWLQRKRYQYEVTFSLYMLTPTEKFIFSMFSQANGSLLLHPNAYEQL